MKAVFQYIVASTIFFVGSALADTMSDVDRAIQEAKNKEASRDGSNTINNQITNDSSNRESPDDFTWFPVVLWWYKTHEEVDLTYLLSLNSAYFPLSTVIDLAMFPTNLSEYQKLHEEMAYEPSEWNNPRSMIAKAN